MRRAAAVLALALLAPAAASAQMRSPLRPDSAFLTQLRWRSIGPANMGGRVSDIEANPQNPKVIYVGFATGGLWKSVNAGTTWTAVFDQTGVHSVSDIAIAASDTSIVYAGTGEEDSRNSMSPGSGVFKSTDAGRTWTSVGLRETHHIGRVVVHPTNPNVVWVAALGHAWGPNRERGIYKTIDGGQTWRNVNFISDRAGFVDLTVDPSNPDVLIAASWERQRGPYFLRSGGPGSALWRSTDGGERWTRITGNAASGLPTTTLGRMGVAFAPSNPQVVYAIVEADSNPNPASLRRGFVPDSSARQRLQSGLFRSSNGGTTWERMNSLNNRPFYYSNVRVDPRNPERVYWISTQVRYSNDGGRTYRQVGQGIHVDYHALWINPNDPDHYIVGQDGGIAQTFDRGRTYDAQLQMALGQFYHVSVDMQRPFWVCGGLQDNGTWCGPTETTRGGIRNSDWMSVNGGDGFYSQTDPNDPNIVYVESQGGNTNRLDLRTWERRGIRPGVPAGGGGFGGGGAFRERNDSIVVWRGDTTVPAAPDVQRRIDSVRAAIRGDTAWASRNRFNWSTPFFLSPHNATTVYLGGHRLWKSVNRGDSWVPISDDLSTRDTVRLRVSLTATGGVTSDITSAETHGTITTISESRFRPGILYAGTDDGNVWMTRNDGTSWDNLTGRFPGVPPRTWVSRVEASPHDSATVYVSFDGHRDDNFRPHVFVSADFGRTFRSIAAGIPDNEYVHTVREHPRRPGVLFLGTEVAAYVSTDGGGTWSRLMNGLPPVPVHDVVVHPRDRALVAATHGRSIFVMDIGPLEEATDSILAAPAHLFAVEPALLYNSRAAGGGVGAVGSKLFNAPNPPFGARMWFRVTQGASAPMRADTGIAEGGAQGGGGFGGGGPGGGGPFGGGGQQQAARGDTVLVVITDVAGDTVRTLRTSGNNTPLRLITWDLRRNRAPLSPSQLRDSTIAARRQQAVRDSIRAAGGPGGGPGGGGPGGFRDPTPGEPGVAQNPNVQGGFGGGGGGGGGFGGFGPFVEPGSYRVTVRFNGREYSRVVQVVRATQNSALAGGWQ